MTSLVVRCAALDHPCADALFSSYFACFLMSSCFESEECEHLLNLMRKGPLTFDRYLAHLHDPAGESTAPRPFAWGRSLGMAALYLKP